MAGNTVTVCEHLSDFTVSSGASCISACWCHLPDAVVFAYPALVRFDPQAVRICGADRTFPVHHSHETE